MESEKKSNMNTGARESLMTQQIHFRWSEKQSSQKTLTPMMFFS